MPVVSCLNCCIHRTPNKRPHRCLLCIVELFETQYTFASHQQDIIAMLYLQTISLTMTELQLSDDCWHDYVILHDGPTDASPELHWYSECGYDFSTVTSSGSSVLVVFASDESDNTGWFSLSWTFSSSGQGGFYSSGSVGL